MGAAVEAKLRPPIGHTKKNRYLKTKKAIFCHKSIFYMREQNHSEKMVQLLFQTFSEEDNRDNEIICLECSDDVDLCIFRENVCQELNICFEDSLFFLPNGTYLECSQNLKVGDVFNSDGVILEVRLPVKGGIDFQHREGGKTGSGGPLSESQAALERKERLRKLALETIDITKDPYFMRNHLGTFECKLCLTLHPNEGNYLAHTQGKRHQYNIGRRAAMEAKNAAPRTMIIKEAPVKRVLKIGRPGYKVSPL
jgi:hypothetical protein